MSQVPARRFALEGPAAALASALDQLHVHAEVCGVEERDGACEVWLAGEWPAAIAVDPAVEVTELPITADLFAHTGREQDAPVPIAADLWVRPPWVARPPGLAGIELVVPRGGAFGSGEHASTRAALLALHRCWPARAVDVLVDVGTGSGILALYGATRGARAVFACDVDAAAARAAAELVPGSRVVCGPPATLAILADVVVANLTAGELDAELPALARLWDGRGLLVLSGLRGPREVDACRAAARTAGIAPVPGTLTVADYTALAFVAADREPVRQPAAPRRDP